MTEDQIERRVERAVNHLDHAFMRGQVTRENYDIAMRQLHQWAERELHGWADREYHRALARAGKRMP